jgi:truncated hemoglobin YjbI
MSLFEEAGGEPVLRIVMHRFVERVFSDGIIGFLFEGKDAARVEQHEYEHAVATLGAPVPYTGRPIVSLHRTLRINAGQFRRRLAILRQEIDRAGIPPHIRDFWLAAQQKMQAAITDGTDCHV